MPEKIERFEDIIAWQKSKELSLLIYVAFKECRDFDFCSQIKRASVSVMNNIAEGYERKGDREFKHFLFISKGSAGEVRSMLLLAKELKYISESQFIQMSELSTEISRMLSGFIKKLG